VTIGMLERVMKGVKLAEILVLSFIYAHISDIACVSLFGIMLL